MNTTRLKRMLPLGILVLGPAAILAFEIAPHMQVTRTALASPAATATLTGGQLAKFSRGSIEEICESNEGTDSVLFGNAALYHPEWHFTNEEFQRSSQGLIDAKSEIVNLVTASPADGPGARRLLGRALHTIQDFYAHSNWVELGNATPNTALGTVVMPNPLATTTPCPVDRNVLGAGGGGVLTSGYFNTALGCSTSSVDAGKCFHGNYNNFLQPCTGINKDRPGDNPLHFTARDLARQSSETYISQILSQLAGNDRAILALMGGRCIAFAVDDTGSMGGEINGVRLIIQFIVNLANLDPSNAPNRYVLCRFGDPDVGPPTVTDQPSVIIGAANSLFPSGGGDCPEYSMSGVLETIEQCYPDSELYLFTDASAKDSALASFVSSRANEKGIHVHPILTGSCSPIDPAYVRVARETGGQLFFLGSSEVALLQTLIAPTIADDSVVLRSVSGTLDKRPKLISIPVDSTISRIVLSVSVESGKAVALRRPSGKLLLPSDPGVTYTNLTSGSVFIINAPQPGNWVCEVAGSGAFSLLVRANSSIDFTRCDAVVPSGDLHGGFLRRDGQTVPGESVHMEAAVFGPVTVTGFDFVNELGATLSGLSLVQNYQGTDPDHFHGVVTIPTGPYRIAMLGIDTSGNVVRRELPALNRPQSIRVTPIEPSSPVVGAGASIVLQYEVTSVGLAQSLHFAAHDSQGFALSLSTTNAALAADGVVVVSVTVSIPEGTPAGTTDTVTLVASRVDDSSQFNSGSIDLAVSATSPLDCLGLDYMAVHPFGSLALTGSVHPGSEFDVAADPLTITLTTPNGNTHVLHVPGGAMTQLLGNPGLWEYRSPTGELPDVLYRMDMIQHRFWVSSAYGLNFSGYQGGANTLSVRAGNKESSLQATTQSLPDGWFVFQAPDQSHCN